MLFTISKHAEQRLQQRGFKLSYINLILKYGKIEYKPGNCFEYKIFKKDIEYIIQKSKQIIQDLDKCYKKANLVDQTHKTIITMYNFYPKKG